MKVFEKKSRLRHIAHNPTGELMRVVWRRVEAYQRLRTIKRK